MIAPTFNKPTHMKKTLLFFIFLFTTVFYAQVNDVVHCSGNNNFDLNEQKTYLIGDLDPDQTTISYHLSLADATNNINAIANPADYNTAASSTTIYARIDNNGTIKTNFFNLIVNPILTAETVIQYVNCIPTIVITGNGGDSNYEYSHAGVIFTRNNVITNPSPGNQIVYIRDGNGCVASKSLIVESLSPLSWIANKMDPVSCQGANDGIIEITGSGGKAPYLYSIGNGNEFTSSNVFNNLDVGNYTMKIQDSTGCITSFSLQIRQRYPSIVMTTVTTNDSNSTNEGKIELIVSGGPAPYNYSLKDSNGILIPSKITNPFTGLAAGSYEALVTDANGCTLSQKGINILNGPTPLTATAMVTPITCIITTGTITITPNGGALPYQYSIDNGKTYTNSNIFANLVDGTYNIKVIDNQGTEISVVAIIEPINLPQITTTITNLLCNGASNGRISIGASGGKAPNVFSIDEVHYTSYTAFENLPAGNYLASVKDSNGCIVSKSVVLSAPPPITFNIKIKDKTVTVDATGGDAKNPNDYALDGGSYSKGTVFSNVSYGNHVVHVKTVNNCTASTSIEVTLPMVSTVAIDKGTITITTTGGVLPYKYSLADPSGMPIITSQSSNIFTEVINGSYLIVVTDSKGDTFVHDNIKISESSSFTGTTILNPITCANLTGIITVTAIGGKSPYQYSLDNGLHYRTSNVFPDLTAGSYTITIRDLNNFKTNISAAITNAKPVLVSAEIISEITCYGASDGRLKANVIQGQAPYTFTVDNSASQNNDTFSNLQSGFHTIKVTDSNSCSAIVSITINDPIPLKSTVVVNDKSITASTVDGTPPYTYFLYNNTVLITGPQTSNTFDNLPTGLYNLQIKDSRGCTFLQNDINISELSPLNVTAAITKEMDCISNASLEVNAVGGLPPYSYSINGGAFQTNNTFNNLSAGTYIIDVKDAGNTISNTNSITISPLVSVNGVVLHTNPTNCCNASITIIANSGQAPFYYSIDNGLTYSSTNTFYNLQAGTYVAFIKDSKNCISPALLTAIDPSQGLTATATVLNTTCNGGSNDGAITINATGGTAPYTYSIGNDYVSGNVFNNLSIGNYYVTVKDALGYVFTMVTTIVEPPVLSMTAFTTNATTISDDDGTITVSAVGGVAPYSYALVKSGYPINLFQANPIFTSLKVGQYDVAVRDANGCIHLQTITIVTKPNSVIASVTTTSITCNGPGIITVNATGGTVPYQYSFDNGATYTSSNEYSIFNPGNYPVKVRDAENNTTTILAEITQATYPAIATTLISAVQCKGNNTGSIAAVSAGVAPYLYSLDYGPYISGIDSSMVFTNLLAGMHNITVKDANGCLATAAIAVSEPAIALTTLTVVKNQTITVNASGGAGNYLYAISPNLDLFQTNNVFAELTPGLYTVNTQDKNGCSITMNALVDPPAPSMNGQIKLTLEFKPGQTLADLVIDGQNIKWYVNQNPLARKTSKMNESPLPLTTVIEDGATYYASQTINGIESIERLEVTVKSGTLGKNDFAIKDFTFYPNPVKNIFTISNTSVIDEVILMSIKGEALLTKRINSLHSEIDLSNFAKGVYFLKIKVEGAEKTVKLIKE